MSTVSGDEGPISPHRPRPSGAAGAPHMVGSPGARVLVVDDEPNITELLGMALRYEGFTVQTAATGRAALTAVTQFSPALVILADLELDDEAHEVRRGHHVIELTTTEYRLLRFLLINSVRVLTRTQILDHVWHYDF